MTDENKQSSMSEEKQTLQNELSELRQKFQELEKELEMTIDVRDSAELRATTLAESVGEYFGESVGEHSSANDPIENAKDILNGLYPSEPMTLERYIPLLLAYDESAEEWLEQATEKFRKENMSENHWLGVLFFCNVFGINVLEDITNLSCGVTLEGSTPVDCVSYLYVCNEGRLLTENILNEVTLKALSWGVRFAAEAPDADQFRFTLYLGVKQMSVSQALYHYVTRK